MSFNLKFTFRFYINNYNLQFTKKNGFGDELVKLYMVDYAIL